MTYQRDCATVIVVVVILVASWKHGEWVVWKKRMFDVCLFVADGCDK